MKTVQNEVPAWEDIQPVVDDVIVDTVHDIFKAVIELNALDDIFTDLSSRLIDDLKANSILEYNLELTDDQKDHLRKAVKAKGEETVRNYLANLNSADRTKEAYGVVRNKTTSIADAVLSSIGQEVNRGAIINAQAVQANSKNKAYDEILFRKTKSSGDITVPTSCIIISTNCVDVIKSSCQEEKETGDETENKAADEKPAKSGKKKGKG
jgi:hypothetical protein